MSATLAFLLGASVLTIAAAPALAGPNPSIDSSPSNATTATALEWTFSNANPASCELTNGATTVVALTDCTSPADYDVSADAGGSYTFTVYASDAADVVVGTTPSATSTVDVAPVAPTITIAPTTPDNDPTPSWSFTLPTDASATCELDDPSSNAVETVSGCTSPFTASDLNNAPANGVNGSYQLSVTPTAGGVTGAAATSTYDFDTVQPPAPSVSADATTGYSLLPTFTVGGLVSGATLTCSVTGPGPAVTVQTCGASSVLDLSGGGDGSYTLHVTQTKAGNVSTEGTASYLLDTHTPATPTVTAPTSPGTDASPTFTISGIESGGTLQCSVSGPSTVPAPTCGPSTTLDLSGAGEGTYTLTVTVQDAAGKDSAPASATYEFEAGGPAVPVVTAPSSPSNSRAPLFTVSDSDPVDLTYDCTVTGPSSVTTSECGPDTVIDLSGAADGTYQLSVVAIDGLGQAGPAGLASYTLDTTPPPAPVVTGPASPSLNTSPSFSITEAEPGTTLSCSLSGPISFPIPPARCANGLVLDLSGAGHDGVYALSVTATDPAGNVSSAGTATYTLDTTPPPLPVVVAPPSPSNDLTPTFTYSDSEVGVTLTCVLKDPGTAIVASGNCPVSGTFNTAADPLDGTYRLTVTATDAAGNTSSAGANWTRDTMPPPAPVVTAPPSPSNDLTPSFTVTDSETGVTFTCTLTGPGSSNVFTGTCPLGNSFDLSGFGDGSYTLSVTATDAAGNTGPAGSDTYVLDTTAPPVPTIALLAPVLSPGNSTSPQFTVTDTEAGVSYVCSVSGVTPVPPSAITCGATTTIDLSGVGRDGDYTLSVTATDPAGNVSSAGTATYTLDTTPPPLPVVVAPPSPSNDLTPTFTYSDSEVGVTLTCVLKDPGTAIVASGNCPVSGTFNTAADPLDGTYRLTVTATDAAGNTSSAGANWTRDTMPPPAPVVTAPPSPSNDLTPSFTVTDSETGVTFTCTLTGPGSSNVFTGTCPLGNSFDLSGFGDGSYTLSVTATDAAGNTGPAGSDTYVLDTTAPPVPTIALLAPVLSPGNSTSPQFTVTDTEAGVSYVCSVSGVTPVPPSAITCGATTTIDLSGVGRDGDYTLSVTATDPAGNVSSAGTATYTLDTVAPPNPTVVAPASPSNDLTPTFTIGDTEPDAILGCVLTGPGATTVYSNLCPANGTFDLTGFGDGTYSLTVTATDPAGNTAPSTATAVYVLDTVPPPAPTVVLSAPASSPGNDPVPQFTVSDSESGVSYSCSVTGPTPVPPSAITCGATTTVDLTGAGRDGSYRLSVTATDAAGNTSTAGTRRYVLDTTPPPTPTVNLSNPVSSPGNVAAPQFSVSDTEAGVTYSCSVTGATPVPNSAITCGATTTVDLSGAGRDGGYTLSVTATDVAGNVSAPGTSVYTLDTTPPPAPAVTLTVPASSPGNVTAPQFSVTDSEVGVSLLCSVTGPTSVPGSAVTCGATTTVDLSGAGRDGTYTLSVEAVDAAGNISPAGTALYTLDTVPPPAPTVVLSAPASSPGNDPVPQFTVSDSESGVSYSCSVTGPTPVPPSAITCGATTTVDLTGAGRDGSYRLSVTATDAAGNTSTAGTRRYVLDTTPPPTPTVNLSNPVSSPGNVAAPQFSVSDTEAGVTYSCSVTGATPVPNSAITCGATTTVDLSGAGRDGGYTLSVTATDVAGNVSAPGTAVYTLDTTPPPAPAVTLTVPASSPGNVTAPQFSVTDSEVGVSLLCSVTGPTSVPGSAVTCGATTTVDLSGAGRDGTYTLSVEAVDAAGNISPAGTALYTLDTTAPPRPVIMLSSPTSSPSNDVEPSWTVTDTEAGVTFTCTMTGPTPVPSSAISCGATTTVDLSGAGRDGTYTLSITATDAAGNTSAVRNSTYKLDTTAPPVPTVTLTVPASSPGNVTAPQFTVTDSESGDTLACNVTGATTVPGSAVTCGATTTVDLSGPGRDGSYTLSVTATDAAGNTSAAGTATYVLDTTAPPAPVVVSPGASTKMPIFGITDGDPTVVLTCSMTSPRGRTVFPLAPPATCPADGTFDTTAFADGDYTLIVTATDPAGNSTSSTTIWLRDTTPPPVPTVGLAVPASSPGNVTAPQFSVSDTEAGVTYACSVSGPTAVPNPAVTCGTTTTVDLSGPGRDGLYTLSVTATDTAGNTSTAGTATYVLDTTPPPAPTVSLSVPASSPGNVTSPQFTVSDTEVGVTYTCSVTGATPVPGSAIACGATTTVNLAGSGRDGLYTLSVTATDPAGNASTTVGAASYVLDTMPPPAPIVALSTPLQSPGNVVAPQFLVTDTEPGVTLTCSASGATAVPGSAITCGPLTSVDLSGAGRDGAYTLSVMATDAAGNTSSAGTAAYTLDTTPPDPPVVGLASATRSSSKTPLWTWQFGFNDQTTAFDTATCTVNGPRSWTSTTTSCAHHFSTTLAGGDGSYTVTVTLTDEAGNSVSAVSPIYMLDSTAPAGPTVFLLHPSSGAGLDRHPVWSVDRPPGTTAMCTLRQGGDAGTVVSPEAVCPNPTTFSLVGLADGLFTLEVVAVDAAGNTSFPAWSSYALVPTAPRVRAPDGQNASAVWTVIGNTRDTFVCTLLRGNRVVNGPHPCGVHPTFDMTNLPAATYTLSVVQVGAEGVRSAPGSASWFWDGPPTGPNPPGGGGHHPGGTGPKKHPKNPNPLSRIPSVVNRQLQKIKREVGGITAPFIHPLVHPNRLTQAVVKAVQNALGSVGSAGGGTGFPLLLLGLVLAFLLVQNRIDRRDPKLALASIAADDTVEFQPPPSRRDRP